MNNRENFSAEQVSEYFFELILDTVEQLDFEVKALFLQKFLKSLIGVEVPTAESVNHWRQIWERRHELSERLGRPVDLRTAAVDYFGAALLLRNPILLEYKDLKRLREDAATDPLTGLHNRRLFEEAFARELNRSQRHSYPLTVLLLDLRNFKKANDTYGHAAGDEVLIGLARACRETLRESDYSCRLGGDEFALLLPQAGGESAHPLAERITEKFDAYANQFAPGVDLGLDYGIASYPEDGDTPTKLLDAADRNLYAYKNAAHGIAWESVARRKTRERIVSEAGAEARTLEQSFVGRKKPLGARNRRRHERFGLEETDSYGLLVNGFRPKVARVLDLSYGGVSFLLDRETELPDTFYARLHVPVLPLADFKVKRLHTTQLTSNWRRLGCRFAS